MAFFTRPNISVPILPATESISITNTNNSTPVNPTTGNSSLTEMTSILDMKKLSSAPASSSSDSAGNQKYEYTIETFGVQV